MILEEGNMPFIVKLHMSYLLIFMEFGKIRF